MANKSNRTCLVCGNKYYYCSGHCQESLNKPSWMAIYCSENCRTLFQGATDYKAGEITKEQAKEIIDKADLSNMSNFKESIQKFINEFKNNKNKKIESSEYISIIDDKKDNERNKEKEEEKIETTVTDAPIITVDVKENVRERKNFNKGKKTFPNFSK